MKLMFADDLVMPLADAPWFVIGTKVGKETYAKYHLERQRFEVYMPMAVNNGVAKPFFPNYLFVRASLEVARWQAMYSTLGVKRVFSMGEQPVPVRPKFIDQIRAREVGGFIELGLRLAAACPYKKGDRAKTLDGLVDVLVHEVVDARRVLVLVSMLGRDSLVTVDWTKLTRSQS